MRMTTNIWLNFKVYLVFKAWLLEASLHKTCSRVSSGCKHTTYGPGGDATAGAKGRTKEGKKSEEHSAGGLGPSSRETGGADAQTVYKNNKLFEEKPN